MTDLAKDSSRYTRVTETAGVYLLKRKHPLLKKMRKSLPAARIHGHKIWDSSYLVMHYLNDHPPAQKSHIMEVGCGWGLLGIYCAKTFGAKVTGVDADGNVLPYVKVLAALNDVKVKTRKEYFQKIPKNKLARQDLIVGSDICFWDELTDALWRMIKRAHKAGVKKIVIADPGRSPFMKLAKKCRKKYDAKLISSDIDWPGKASGYLLVIETNECRQALAP